MINDFTCEYYGDDFFDVMDREVVAEMAEAEKQRTHLSNRVTLGLNIWIDISDQVDEILPHLRAGFDFTVPELVGHEYWRKLSPLDRRFAVLFLKQEAKDRPSYLKETTDERHGEICFQVGTAN